MSLIKTKTFLAGLGSALTGAGLLVNGFVSPESAGDSMTSGITALIIGVLAMTGRAAITKVEAGVNDNTAMTVRAARRVDQMDIAVGEVRQDVQGVKSAVETIKPNPGSVMQRGPDGKFLKKEPSAPETVGAKNVSPSDPEA